MFAYFTSRMAAEKYLIDASNYLPENTSGVYDLYILEEPYGLDRPH